MKKWCLLLALPACAQSAAPGAHDVPALDLESRVAQFAPAALTADLGKLESSEQQALKAIIEAARLLDPIFDRQAYAQNPELEAQLSADTSQRRLLQSDKAWMDLDSPVEITIGPYETYEDELLGLKASLRGLRHRQRPQGLRRPRPLQELPPGHGAAPADPDAIKTKRGSESPIRVVDLVFTSGDARKSVQTIAFNLPNDEKVRAEKGAKKVLLRNLIATKFNASCARSASAILDGSQLPPRRPGLLPGGPVPRAVAQPRPRLHHRRTASRSTSASPSAPATPPSRRPRPTSWAPTTSST
jgi:hypothetical protein